MEIVMDSQSKSQSSLKQKAQAPIGQAGRVYTNTKVNSKRPGGTFKLPSTSRTKSPLRMNKYFNAQGSTKSLQRSYSIESMDSDTDCIVASLNLEGITNNCNT